jgi:YD repeat-containing protein
VIKVDSPGIWVVDVEGRSVRRLADLGPFDVAASTVLIGRGRSVWAVPVAGGAAVERYVVAAMASQPFAEGYHVDQSRQAITMLTAAPDGTAFVASTAPVVGPSGATGASTEDYRLVTPDGAVLPAQFQSSHAAWTDDGAALATYDSTGVRALRRDGSVAWGPVAVPAPIIQHLWVGPDGRSVAVAVDAERVQRYRVDAGAWDQVGPVWSDIDIGPDGRYVGQPTPPPNWDGRRPLGLVAWDPTTDGVSRLAATGSKPDWSPDGRALFAVDAPLTGADDGSHVSFRVRDASGAPVLSVDAVNRDLRLAYDDNGRTRSWPGPQWTSDGRYLVLVAAPFGSGPWVP